MTDNMDVVVSEQGGIETPAEVPEKTLTVSRVNEIVKREKAAAGERARQEAEARHAQEIAQLKSSMQPVGGMEAPNVDKIYEQVYSRIMDEAQKHQAESQKAEQQKDMERVASQYFLRMGKGKEIFPDFDEVMADFDPSSFPQVVFLASEFENTPAIMYELSKNPQKLAALDLMASKSPAQAKKMMQGLAESISKNDQAKAENVSAPSPLSRLKSSTTVGADTGAMTVRDYKKAKWLKA